MAKAQSSLMILRRCVSRARAACEATAEGITFSPTAVAEEDCLRFCAIHEAMPLFVAIPTNNGCAVLYWVCIMSFWLQLQLLESNVSPLTLL